jgi:hypothetical protein
MDKQAVREAITDLCDQVHDVNRNVMESTLGWNEIGARTQAILARQQFEVMDICLDSGARQLQAVVEANSPFEFVTREIELFSELNGRLVEMAQEISDVQNQARVEMSLCVEDGISAVQSAIPKAA